MHQETNKKSDTSKTYENTTRLYDNLWWDT